MMNRLKIFIIALFSSILFSCDDYLTQIPETLVSDPAFWKTEADFKDAANDFYRDLKGYDADDMNSDIFCWYGNAAPTSVSRGDIAVPVTDGRYSDPYKFIRKTNYLLEKAKDFPDQNKIKRYIAEAYFFRAYQYLRLFENYGGVIIVERPLDLNSPELKIARSDRETTFKFIIDDLDKAISDLPWENQISSSDKGRVSKQAAYGLKARISLFEGTWRKFRDRDNWEKLLENAVTCSDEVIKSNQYQIFNFPQPISTSLSGGLGIYSYKYLFILDNVQCNWASKTKADNKEYILAKRHDRNSGIVAEGLTYIQYFSPTKKLMDMYLCKNGLPIHYNNRNNDQFLGYGTYNSEYQNRDTRLTSVVQQQDSLYYGPGVMSLWGNPNPIATKYNNRFGAASVTGYYCNKFVEETNNATQSYDLPEIRYAEVLLIYAEALYERYGNISDDDLSKSINLLRERGQVAGLTNALVNNNGLDMRTQIRNERTVELQMEGFRLKDLKRWNTAGEEMPQSICGFYIANRSAWARKFGAFKTDENGFYLYQSSDNRQWFDYYELYPLPSQEIELNPNLKQNPGYYGADPDNTIVY